MVTLCALVEQIDEVCTLGDLPSAPELGLSLASIFLKMATWWEGVYLRVILERLVVNLQQVELTLASVCLSSLTTLFERYYLGSHSVPESPIPRPIYSAYLIY